MNTEQAKGKFDQLKGEIKKTWGKLTDDDVALYNGNKDKFFGRLEEVHGVAREQAEKQLNEFEKNSATAQSKMPNRAA